MKVFGTFLFDQLLETALPPRAVGIRGFKAAPYVAGAQRHLLPYTKNSEFERR